MDWDAWIDMVREYEERTFADYIDGGCDMYEDDDYDRHATEEEDEYDE